MSEAMTEQLAQAKLGETAEKLRVDGRDACRLAVERMAQQATNHIEILTYNLDAPLYDQPPFLDAVKQLALSSRSVCLRILLQDNEKVQKEGHRLIELARRLTSKIEIRRPSADYEDLREAFFIADTQGYLRLPNSQRYEGEADFYNAFKARDLMQLFNEIWEQAEPDSAIRRLYL